MAFPSKTEFGNDKEVTQKTPAALVDTNNRPLINGRGEQHNLLVCKSPK